MIITRETGVHQSEAGMYRAAQGQLWSLVKDSSQEFQKYPYYLCPHPPMPLPELPAAQQIRLMPGTHGISIYPFWLVSTYILLVVKYLNITHVYLVLQSQVERLESYISAHGNELISVALKRIQDKPNRIQADKLRDI